MSSISLWESSSSETYFTTFPGCLCFVMFPILKTSVTTHDLSLMSTVKDQRIVINILVFMTALMSLGWNDATLSYHLKREVSKLKTSYKLFMRFT